METKNTLKTSIEDLTRIRKEMNILVADYFATGGYEFQLSLLSAAIQDIVNKGAGDEDASLDNEFAYTNRYIRESVYELTELQRFLLSLRETYLRYTRCADYLRQQSRIENQPVLTRKTNK